MLRQKAKRDHSAFNDAILTTFGKLDQQDIDDINGNIERLISHLAAQYELTPETARFRAERFLINLTGKTRVGSQRVNAEVEV
jgi:hypothetical protein